MVRFIKAHDSLVTAAGKCLAGTGKMEDFTCEHEFFANEKISHRRRRQMPNMAFMEATKQVEVAKNCWDLANKMRDDCFHSHKDGCIRGGLYVNIIFSQ